MKLILNIGLDVQATSTIAADVALQIVKANGFLVHKHKVVQSDTEPTLVVEVSFDPTLTANVVAGQAAYRIAVDLKQDCIAVYRAAINRGELIGPRAAEWGKFNHEFFFLLDGTRLAQSTSKAA